MILLDRPRDHDDHTVADFLELLCLVNLDRQVSADTLRDFINDHRGDQSFRLSDDQLSDVLNQISWRVHAFQEWYPFELDPHSGVMETKAELTPQQKRYISLLVCGNLPFFKSTTHKELTDFFEIVSGEVLQEIWPLSGKTLTVGKNNTALAGSKSERMNTLGKMIGADPNVKDTDFRKGDRGDGGIDMAAVIEMDSFEHRNIVSALAQCACSRSDWAPKHSEITNTKLRFLFPISVPWVEMLFTPISFRSNSGNWAVRGDVPGVTLVDRLRIVLSWVRSGDAANQDIPETVEALLNFRLDVV